ncbi:MAG: hypothetical protein ETSY1_38195 [Candidatus Entotheonella factor]|uniref:Guanylate cyclase domain-containing protein n=1 Tax=Entotheonella factor TaxID=1429438 RepID=W4L6Y4_ENTF1|nr:MAG: hypothetical protein ETSY1_38195 [Candidatus Entotheonella factor]
MLDEVIDRFEGHAEQRAGHGVLVYFGYPQAREHDAHRAVRVGLAIVQALSQVHQQMPGADARLNVRVGIHTGLVVVRDSSDKREQLTLGNAPYIATQLASFAEPNTVVISPSTLQLVDGYMVCEPIGSYLLDELSESLGVHQVLHESEARDRIDAAAHTQLTSFIGREQELELLRQRWEQAKAGNGQAVMLSGEAGIGKSRMLHQLRDVLETETHTWMTCRCSQDAQQSAFYPVIEYLLEAMQIHREDEAEVRLHKLERALEQYGFDLKDAVPLVAPLCSVPLSETYAPLRLTPQRQKQRLLEVLLRWFLQEAEWQSSCLVIEDLHWADPSTQAFFNLLIEHIPTTRLMIILTFRPAFLESQPWGGRSHLSHITLNRLTPAQIEHMLTQITGGKPMPEELREQLVARTDGVPLFVEEMTRMVLELGLVKERDDHYELAGPLDVLDIPVTLHDSLMARLDRLGQAKSTAQLAATLGREFSFEDIRAVAPRNEAALHKNLTRLVDAELLYQRGLPPHTHYIFKHALIQDAAYQSLLRSTRREYHGQIAQALEERLPEICEAQPERLAHHYTEAGLPAQAIAYWHRASQHAMARAAHTEAVAHVQRGLELVAALPDTPERRQMELMCQTTLGTAMITSKGHTAPEVEEAFMQARQLCLQMGDSPQVFPVLRGLWMFYFTRGEGYTAIELGEHLLQLAERHPEPALLLEAHRALAITQLFQGELASSKVHFEHASGHYDAEQRHQLALRFGEDPGVVNLAYAALNQCFRGYPEQALRHVYEALAIAQEPVYPYSLAAVRLIMAMIHHFRYELPEMQEHLEACLALAREHDLPFIVALGQIFQGWLTAVQEDCRTGIAQIQQGLQDYQTIRGELALPYILGLLADAYRRAGQTDEGFNAMDEALESLERTGERIWASEVYRLHAELFLQRTAPDVGQAESQFFKAIEAARKTGAKLLELRATVSLGRLWQEQGKAEAAQTLLAPLYNGFTEGVDTAAIREAKALLDELAG